MNGITERYNEKLHLTKQQEFRQRSKETRHTEEKRDNTTLKDDDLIFV